MYTIEEPLVSVYIPTHNRSSMVGNAIESILNQSYTAVEIIVVDDGSTDDTEEVVKSYFGAGNVIYFKHPSPLGACAARNKAIENASGTLITGLDDDDLFKPDRITELVTVFNQGNYSCITTGITERTSTGDIERNFNAGVVSLDKLLHHNILGNQVLTKTEYLRNIGGFDQSMPSFQDYDTWVRLVACYGNAYKINSSSYLWLTGHEAPRISVNYQKKIAGFEIFHTKHHEKMTKKHLQTHEILKKRLSNQDFNFLELLQMTNFENWRQSFTLFADRRLPWFKNIINKVRTR
jgi:glycosyltransferase involved in cell wall biosynthesis